MARARSKVVVVGDVMLDIYWMGVTTRISPEAPVPVVAVKDKSLRPGGAANVAVGVTAWEAIPVALLGAVGDDANGALLEQLINDGPCQCKLLRIEGHVTTSKLRVMSGSHHVVRIDDERPEPLGGLADDLVSALNDVQNSVIIFSDYAKGVVSSVLCRAPDLIERLQDRGNQVLIDPKGDDFTLYAGANLLTPNLHELEVVVGKCRSDKQLYQKASRLREALNLSHLLVTRSGEGMTLFSSDGVRHFPAFARDVTDVTGAGDTVIAVIAAELALGQSLPEAVQTSCLAAGVAVSTLGCAEVSRALVVADS